MKVVVVGSGIAGLTAALHAREAGHRVAIVTKGALGDGSTRLAQGGIAGWYGPADSSAQHAADTITAGAGLNDPAAVDVLVRDGADRIAELIARGTAFDRAPDGSLLLGREAAHSHARIVHAGGDATGAEIVRALVAHVRDAVRMQDERTPAGRHAEDRSCNRSSVLHPYAGDRAIEVLEGAFLTDLAVEDGFVRGIRMLVDGREQTLSADAVILATGGAGHLYAHTTNPPGATGDGIAAAIRAGAAVADLEFVQFHPTVLAADTIGLTGEPFLVSEAVRGEGATLIDDAGHRFCFDAHPDGELAPRDVVARAIARRAAEQGAPIRLDARMLGVERFSARFPTIDRELRRRGIDPSREPIPVTPAAHYLMGGIVTDLDGRTSIPGLYAVGETARTGVHGANRLASNSLLEGAVFGARAAAALASPALLPRSLSEDAAGARVETRAALPSRSLSEDAAGARAGTRTALQQLMWEEVGLLRHPDRLAAALDTIRGWLAAASAPRTGAEHEDANLLLLAEATACAALARTESIGAHHLEAPILERV